MNLRGGMGTGEGLERNIEKSENNVSISKNSSAKEAEALKPSTVL